MLYVVWYFVSGCMLVFGVTIVWTSFRLRAGDAGTPPAPLLIGALYVAVGAGGMIYRHGDPFMGLFIVLGALLLASSLGLRAGVPSAPRRAGSEARVPGASL